ncbi:Metaxin-2-like protein [Leptotrombidium deliense]|uniref:Metaxin-2-like protein n=1 Tax=Leptotrombidium deliense TaxID=299467 RepID=A0A443SVD6_9ACAR|nr:Metaxin-2-like protein [Leptotrombidium deliense]
MPSTLTPELITAELGGSEPWPEDCILFQPFEVEQILLPESANCRSVQAFLKMCNLRFNVEMRANAEQMSPTGQVPFMKCGSFVVAEMEPIAQFVSSKGLNNLSQHLEVADKGDMTAYMMLVNTVLYNAELFVCWCHEETLREVRFGLLISAICYGFGNVTYPRYAYAYPWPLNYILCWKKRRAVLKKLSSVGWDTKNVDEVLGEVESCCQALSDRLENRNYFFGDSPTELDALVFGHLSAILTTPLPIDKLAIIVRENEKLVQLCNRIAKSYFNVIRQSTNTSEHLN